ncbi:putative mitochondrial hypothetical protein [Leptomonas pyrrhocoris]|uniref:Large ribosomal subunit protein uL30-like ferredoxin-like fold domain-containing protein n=1 Tax=Leptomonas pyrrhocoris TaxID=157538 RepID=A0A0M9FT75_LEPPY|nr:putative mitochondrial hypothetical protein [Leptomonas pyrrhocoris]KPA75575.1 putative mitochondrial hypothetical protein [Leptomonas pyrrhocoris]|eukprot:XP_015654014.1 putative mitochondrial hypothetical protein [Leptomonas pyrrhocoris]
MYRLLRPAMASSSRMIGCPRTAARAFHLSGSCLAAADSTVTPTAAPPSASAVPANPSAIVAGPYRRVGNVFIVTCVDHPFKFSWEVNRMLRELRLEFMGQTTIVPDIPQVRKRLWRVRHLVRVDPVDLDEAKALIGVPEHVSFRDLASQIPPTFGRGPAVGNPRLRSKMNFMQLRRMRLRDVMHRDQLEKKLLEERRRALQRTQHAAEGEA